MPHITFIHGILNKPPADQLLQDWTAALRTGGLSFDGVTTSMVYWADVLYDAPETNQLESPDHSAHPEPNRETALEGAVGTDDPDERAFVAALSAKLLAADRTAAAEAALERVPLPWWLKRRLLEALVRDAHHYLFDVKHSPRPSDTHRVRTEVRARTAKALAQAPDNGPHVVVAHSLGSVIAYDVLKRVPGVPAIDALLTLGSPLGIDEVQDRLRPEWSRSDGFPRARVRGPWVNVYDPLDPVCLLDGTLRDDFQRDGRDVVEDVRVLNPGPWRHRFDKYAAQPALVAYLADLLVRSDA